MQKITCEKEINELITLLEETIKKDETYIPMAKKVLIKLKNYSNYGLNSSTLMFIQNFMIYTNSYKKVNVQGDFGLNVFLDGKTHQLIPGNIKSLDEFKLLIATISNNLRHILKYKNIKFLEAKNDDENEYFNKRINDFIKINLENLIKVYESSIEELNLKTNKIIEFINLLREYIKQPTEDKYSKILSKKAILNNILNANNITLKKLLKNYLESFNYENSKTNKKPSLVIVESKKENDMHQQKYIDDEYVTLSYEASAKLNEIYLFVRSLNKEDIKEFTSDPYSYFSHLDPLYRDDVAHDFIIQMKRKEEIPYRDTIAKRLKSKLVG